MNQDQRKYLIAQVEKTCHKQIDELKSKIPIKPSLNNYLVASFLDNTIQFADIEELKVKMRTAVLNYGVGKALVRESNDYYYGRRSEDRKPNTVEVVAEDLFIIPQIYKDALAVYEAEVASINDKIKTLNATRETIVMKIQIGSSSTMDKLVMQIDNMGDLDLVNNQLLLGS